MTDSEIIIVIAEACGHKPIDKKHGEAWFKDRHGYTRDQLLNYVSDLNAMHQAEETLTEEQARKYQEILTKLVVTLKSLFPPFAGIKGYVIHATARQRAEAFLRTIGKWVDTLA